MRENEKRLNILFISTTMPFLVYLFYLYTGGFETEAVASIIFYHVVSGILVLLFAVSYCYYWAIMNKESPLAKNLLEDLEQPKEKVLRDSIKEMFSLANLLFAIDLAACSKIYLAKIDARIRIFLTLSIIAAVLIISCSQRLKIEKTIIKDKNVN